MEQRTLGRTGLNVSVLGFGCGFVGGLLVRGSPSDQERAVARALELGINYFDTAALYGDSELNLGRVLTALKADPVVGTKVMVRRDQHDRIQQAIVASVEASLKRLGRECLDLMQLHNCIGMEDVPAMADFSLSAEQVLGDVLPAMEQLRKQGKVRYIGMSGIGRTPPLNELVSSGRFDTVQVIYNLLNPSAAEPVDPGFPAQDFDRLLVNARAQGAGAIGIRALAGGALSGSDARHSVAAPTVDPIGSGATYNDDVRRAGSFEPLVSAGQAASLVDASLRYVVANQDIATAVIGYSSMDQLEQAAKAAAAGPLSIEALQRCRAIRSSFTASTA